MVFSAIAMLSNVVVGLAVHPAVTRPTCLTALTLQRPIRMQQVHTEDHCDAPRPRSLAVSEFSQQMTGVRAQLEADEQANAMMQALRGTNLNDDNKAAAGTRMQVVKMSRGEGEDTLPTTYQPERLAAYFSKRPLAIAQRIVQVLTTSSGWLAGVVVERALGRMTPGSDVEAAQIRKLRGVVVSLGPFFIKLGQALSIRPDILSPRAMVELQQLCDKVPSFDNALAMATIEEELGRTPSSVFSAGLEVPVAAASLGQVYKATLCGSGELVALKVQRPFVLETVSLDLHLARTLGLALRGTPLTSKLDIVDLLDEFAANFYCELDYVLECKNGERVRADMSKLPRVTKPEPLHPPDPERERSCTRRPCYCSCSRRSPRSRRSLPHKHSPAFQTIRNPYTPHMLDRPTSSHPQLSSPALQLQLQALYSAVAGVALAGCVPCNCDLLQHKIRATL